MSKHTHEIRDPIHVFIHLTSDEREVLDSQPFQRLRHIHQLAMTYLVYPGATHRRFEHSLGVMELATRVFDVITNPENLTDEVRKEFGEIGDDRRRGYWRCVLRMAALCHDMGHLPFSHAAEKELLPNGWTHERLTASIIRSDIMTPIWEKIKLDADDVVKIALGPKELKAFEPDIEFAPWETILSEIIVGNAFGVDRMDYLLRDSHHTGVAYGKFDHYRLIDTLRILPNPRVEKEKPDSLDEQTEKEITKYSLGVEQGGIQSAESLMLARYFMYSQVYLHSVRRIYDIHLKDFLRTWLPDGMFSTDIGKLLKKTDAEVTAGILDAARYPSSKGHIHAQRIVNRKHFKVVFERNPEDTLLNVDAGKAVFKAFCDQFNPESFRHDQYSQKGGENNFPVKLRDESVIPSLAISKVLKDLPVISIDFVFVDRQIFAEAEKWLWENKKEIIKPKEEE